MSTKGNENKPSLIQTINFFRLGIAACLLILLCALVFYIGANYSCEQGEGYLDGLKCIDVIDIGACYDEQGTYFVPTDENGTYVDLNITEE